MLRQERADASVRAGAAALGRSAGAAQGADAASQRRDARVALLAGLLAAAGGGAVIFAALREHLPSDFEAHLAFTVRGIEGHPLPGNFLFYAANALFAGFSTDPRALKASLVLVLAAAIGAKVLLSVRFVAAQWRAARPVGMPRKLPLWGAAAAALCSLAAALPVGGHRYLGQIPPNVWHNETTIVSMPLALGLFWTTLSFLRTGSTRWLWWSLPLVALNLAAKPSFVLCVLPGLAVMALLRFRWSPALRGTALLLGATVLLLALQSAYVYAADPTTADGSGISIRPLVVWHAYSANIPLSLLASCVFPLAALTFGGTVVRSSLAVRYAVLLVTIGVAEYALLAEQGPRLFDGNFTWQAVVSMWVLFVVLVSALVPWYQDKPWGVRQLTIAIAFLVQVVAGALYIQHWFSANSFL